MALAIAYIGVGGATPAHGHECQARGAGRAGPACPPSVRPCVRHTPKRAQKGLKIIEIPLGFSLKVNM